MTEFGLALQIVGGVLALWSIWAKLPLLMAGGAVMLVGGLLVVFS